LEERDEPERMSLAKLEKIEPNPPGKWPAEWYPGFTEVIKISSNADIESGHIQAELQTEGKKTKVAQSIEVFYEERDANPLVFSIEEENSADIQFKFEAEKGKKYTFYKIVSVVSEFNDENSLQKSVDISRSSKEKGFNQLYKEHKNAWKNLWQKDIVVKGDDQFQKVIRSMMFYLFCSVDENTNFSIPPMGLATSGYYGHIFWDADTYMFPPLLLMHPEMAKSLVMFRVHALDAAKENAKKNKYKGAMFPWESDEEGEETTPFFAYQNALQENHINGDVAFAQWQYFIATKDTNWLREYGSEVIEETANFWISRVHYNEDKDRYEIGKIVSVSEGLIGINNETYTNSIAKINLELAVKVGKTLNKEINPEWQKISEKMFIPYNKEKEYHPTFEGADAGEGATELWSSVVNLLSYPLQIEMSKNAKRNNLLHAVKSLGESGAGAMMGTNFVPIIAAELGMDSLFNAIIKNTLYGYLRPPFNVLAETHTNNSINFITGAGSFLQQVIFGYAGLRITEEGLVEKYEPMLPENVKSLTLKNFTVGGEKFDIVAENKKLRFIPIK
jgi:trehalose/maltose hydrolase-like predicted phosphorylase